MKLDKDTMIKHRFWFLLGVVPILFLVVLIVDKASVGATVKKEKDDYVGRVKQVDDVRSGSPKNDNFVNPLIVKEKILTQQKDKVWKAAWSNQADLMTWPNELKFLESGYFGDPISDRDRRNYANTFYKTQFSARDYLDLVRPVEFKGGVFSIIRTVGKWDLNREPTVEECWLAQEDLWVQRELLLIIRDALDSVAKFKKVEASEPAKEAGKPGNAKSAEAKKDAKTPAGPAEQVFRNPNWELHLKFKADEKNRGQVGVSGESYIKNINPARRTLPLAKAVFLLKQGNAGAQPFRVPADFLAWDETAPLKNDWALPAKSLDVKLEVEQYFNWQTSPVKRIDALVMGFNSHRMANVSLKAKQIGPAPEAAAVDSPSQTPSSGPGMPGMPSMPGMPGMSGDGRPGAATATTETPNGLVKNRYLDVRDQVRWMPIGMDLIVDQGNMQDVLTAVANSRLGIQTTQVSWSHVHGIRPSTAEGGGEGGREGVGPRSPGGPGGDTAGPPSPPAGGYGQGSPRPGAGGPGMAGPPPGVGYGQGSPRPGGGSGGPRQPFNPGDYAGFPGLGGSGASSSDPEDANLVELSIYGIAALYERFPPKPSSAADASKAPKP